MEIGDLILFSGLVVWAFVTAAYLISLYIKNASMVDIAWPIGFMVIALAVQQAIGSDISQAFMVIWLLVLLWGTRLSLHIATRFNPSVEDWRYKAMRKRSGDSFWWKSYFKIFLLQGSLMMVVGLPLIVSTFAEEIPNWKLILGTFVWAIGFVFQVVGDWQLRKFIGNVSNKGKIITSGLWKYTRHPNYFGEVTMWWGIFIILARSPYCWVALLSPLMITLLILKVSGVPLLEKRWQGNKQWEAYKKKTSAFIPLPPKK